MIATVQQVEHDFRQILIALELISHGSVQSWNSDGRGGFERLLPPGELFPPHLHYRWLWDQHAGDDWQRHVLREATDALHAITHHDSKAPKGFDEREIRRRNVLDCKGMTDQEVILRYRYTIREVREIRIKHNLDDRGEELLILDDDKCTRIRRYAEQGIHERQIARFVGVSASTVRRMLGKAA